MVVGYEKPSHPLKLSGDVVFGFICVYADTGEVITCGDNAAGQLGYPKTAPTPDHMTYTDRAPQIVLALQDLEVTKVTCGDLYCIANCKGKPALCYREGGGGGEGCVVQRQLSWKPPLNRGHFDIALPVCRLSKGPLYQFEYHLRCRLKKVIACYIVTYILDTFALITCP